MMHVGDNQAIEKVPSLPDRERELQPVARELLRGWMRKDIEALPAEIARLGQGALREAADAAARLTRPGASAEAEQVLQELEALAAALVTPPPARMRWWPMRRRSDPSAGVEQRLIDLVGRIDRCRDEMLRLLVNAKTDRARFVENDRALEDVVHLLRALATPINAAAREIRAQNPSRAQRMLENAEARLTERERDLLTQLVITRQGLMTLDLLIANHAVLSAALERARTSTVSALQTAIAARRVAADGQAVARHAEALTQTAAAAGNGRAVGTDHAQLMLGDAIAQARSALRAMAPALQDKRL